MSSATDDRQRSRGGLLQIGEVAEEVDLSLRTVRYYEEVGLLAAPTRTEGGFRLYGAEHLEQLRLIKQMKPLGLSIEEMGALMRARKDLESPAGARRRVEARETLESFADLLGERCAELRKKLRSGERFARQIRTEAESGD